MRAVINAKIETLDMMELENLETHLILEHRLRQTPEYKN